MYDVLYKDIARLPTKNLIMYVAMYVVTYIEYIRLPYMEYIRLPYMEYIRKITIHAVILIDLLF